MRRADIMVDIETLGTNPDSTIFQIAAIAFDITTGEEIAKFNKIADISENKYWEMQVTGSTLKWWLNTNAELFTSLLNKGVGSSEELIKDFRFWMDALGRMCELYLWGNGILFDNKIIQHQMEVNNLGYPIHYKNDRDVRTVVDLACVKLGVTERELRNRFYNSELEAHDAFNDVTNQINLVVNCYKILTSMEEK